MATSGDFYLATSGDFVMAMDSLPTTEPKTAQEFPVTRESQVRTASDPHPPGSGPVTSQEA
jgi:hypothetical protein